MDSAASRVQAFLKARASMTGPVDHDVIYEVWVAGEQFSLLTDDLKSLARAARYLGSLEPHCEMDDFAVAEIDMDMVRDARGEESSPFDEPSLDPRWYSS